MKGLRVATVFISNQWLSLTGPYRPPHLHSIEWRWPPGQLALRLRVVQIEISNPKVCVLCAFLCIPVILCTSFLTDQTRGNKLQTFSYNKGETYGHARPGDDFKLCGVHGVDFAEERRPPSCLLLVTQDGTAAGLSKGRPTGYRLSWSRAFAKMIFNFPDTLRDFRSIVTFIPEVKSSGSHARRWCHVIKTVARYTS